MGVPVSEAQVEWPVEEWLQRVQSAFDNPVLGLLRGQPASDGTSPPNLQQLGDTLYGALFAEGPIRESWLRAQGIAQNRDELLRFRLGLKESRLQRLPWEVLHQSGRPLTTRSDLTFARYAANFLIGQTGEVQNRLPEADAPLRVLMVIASPGDQNHLKLVQEVKTIQELLAAESDTPRVIDIHILDQPDRTALAQALEQGNFQVLHYAGHSDFGEQGGDVSLVNRQTGLTERLSGDDLAGLLVNNQVSLAVFNSCRSGHTAGDDEAMDWRQQNLVQALVNRGVPSVIAMAERIPDEVALAFTQLFYKNLHQGFPIDLSLSRTRQGLISAFGSDRHYWALPILYLQPDFDGFLFRHGALATNYQEFDSTALDLTAAAPFMLPQETPQHNHAPPLSESGTASAIAADDDLDLAIADMVQQVTASTTPPLPVDEAMDSAVTGSIPYESWPEDPETASVATADDAATVAQLDHSPASVSSQPVFNPLPSTPKKSLLLGGTVALVALAGVGAAIFQVVQSPPASPPSAVDNGASSIDTLASASDVDALLAQAQIAIAETRYADARETYEQVLTLALLGQTSADHVSDRIWPQVSDTQNPDLLYIQGRIHWQAIAQLSGDEISYDRDFQQRRLAEQALTAWSQTSDTFLTGLVARGFAAYAMGDFSGAIDHWDTALDLGLNRSDTASTSEAASAATVTDPILLHAYAGLVMARTRVADINPAGLENPNGLGDISPSEQAILQNTTANERAIARETFLRLQEIDPEGLTAPESLQGVTAPPETWNNWLWIDSLRDEWGRAYRYWQLQLNDDDA